MSASELVARVSKAPALLEACAKGVSASVSSPEQLLPLVDACTPVLVALAVLGGTFSGLYVLSPPHSVLLGGIIALAGCALVIFPRPPPPRAPDHHRTKRCRYFSPLISWSLGTLAPTFELVVGMTRPCCLLTTAVAWQ